jgi:hypothetical protein
MGSALTASLTRIYAQPQPNHPDTAWDAPCGRLGVLVTEPRRKNAAPLRLWGMIGENHGAITWLSYP